MSNDKGFTGTASEPLERDFVANGLKIPIIFGNIIISNYFYDNY